MPVFNDLSLDKQYLINEFDGDQVLLVEPIMKNIREIPITLILLLMN